MQTTAKEIGSTLDGYEMASEVGSGNLTIS